MSSLFNELYNTEGEEENRKRKLNERDKPDLLHQVQSRYWSTVCSSNETVKVYPSHPGSRLTHQVNAMQPNYALVHSRTSDPRCHMYKYQAPKLSVSKIPNTYNASHS